ncbi:MAG TPA: metalloregulator ArsR/SmtB family transcription factor [Acidimicrobiales bacterium]|jgi:DNA-binding transcriptional ArsR family regulator
MPASARSSEHIDAVAHALADGTRRGLLRLVRDDERGAGDLATEFPHMSRPAVSQHLRVLHDAGLVSIRAEGNRRLYRARTEELAHLWQFIDEMWTDRLAKLAVAAERAERADQTRSRKTQPPRSNQ